MITKPVTKDGRCMTCLDVKLNEAIKTAEGLGLSIRNIIPKRDKGRIIGYYVLNEGCETAIATID
jgi:hypothetical protein